MAIEYRGSRPYYYRKTWQGGRCVSQYVAAGAMAEMLAAEDSLIRAEQAGRRDAERA